jgi:imidazolonepropionase-like amidohydrolase
MMTERITGLLLAITLTLASTAHAADIAVRADMLYPVTSAPIEDAVVIIRDGKIAQIGSADSIEIPDGMQVVEASVVTPGLIDAHSVVGLAGYLNQPGDQDQLEHSEAMQPELRAIDAYNAREPLIKWIRSFGVTTVHTGHAPGEIIAGQTLIAKTTGDTVEDAVIKPVAMLAATLGEGVVVEPGGARKSPGNRSKAIAMLRAELLKAKIYRDNGIAASKDDEKDAPDRDLRMEALTGVLAGDTPLLITVHRHNDIMSALRIADEFDINIVLDGASESYLLIDEIKAAGVPVILHPAMARAWGEKENLSFTTAAKLINAGIPTAYQSGYESYVPKTRVVLFEAGITLAHGVSFEQALAAVTIESAKILGIADRVGSLEVGKDGDLALYDGDPFEYTSHAVGTIIEGVLVSDTEQ